MANRRPQRGLTLIELLIAIAIAAFVVAALDSVVTLGLKARASGGQTNELVYQGRFALDRMAAKARATPPKALTTPSAGTTGNWFGSSSTSPMYCLDTGIDPIVGLPRNRLVETTFSDTGCTGSTVIANNVTAFSALPAGPGPVDKPRATLSLTLQAGGAPAVTLTTRVRLGGGAL